MKVLINRKPRTGSWGGGNHFVRAFYEHAKENSVELVESLSESPNVIFVFHPESEDGGVSMQDVVEHRKLHPDVKVVIRVNECDARKNTVGVDDVWKWMGSNSDHTIFVSSWIKSYFEMGWKCYSNEIIINGVDRTKFERREKLSSKNGKTNIVCAHWSDNRLKGQDIYEFLDDFVGRNTDYTFTFIGRTKAKLVNSFVIQPLAPEELVKKLSEFDVCVNGTFWDPGPNAVIESIAAGVPTYVHHQSGGAVDFAGADHVFRSLSELENLLLSKNFVQNRDIFLDWRAVMTQVFDRIKSL